MKYSNAKEKNLRFFSGLLNENRDDHYAVAQSKLSHMKRFEKMVELGDFSGKRVLDVGCGLGDFYEFVKEKGINFDYTGVDINPQMIAGARKKYPEIKDKFFVFDILEERMVQTFDYAVSVGPLNLKFAAGVNMEMTIRLLEEMLRLTTCGAALSMTSALTRKPHGDTFYYDPALVLSETVKFCTNVRIDHTYLPHDFTIFCYKNDLYN